MAFGDKPKDWPIWMSPRQLLTRKVQVSPNTVRYETVKQKPKLTKKERKRMTAREINEYYGNAEPILDEYPTRTTHDFKLGVVKENERGTFRYINGVWIRVKDEVEEPVKREFAWTPSKWSNFSFSSYSLDNDDNSQLLVKEPSSYITPSASDIQGRVSAFSKNSIDIVKDLCRACYLKMLDDNDFYSEYFKQNVKDTSYMTPDIQERMTLYENVFTTYIPGFSPLEQAKFLYQAYIDKKNLAARSPDKKGTGTSKIDLNREDYCNPLLNNQLELNDFSRKNKLDILNCVSIIGRLGYQFQVKKEISERVVQNSEIRKLKILREYEQLVLVEPYQRLFPNFFQKFINKDLVINSYVEDNEKKQKLIITLDFSGSMRDPAKQKWVNAILVDRFRYVLKGEAEVFFTYFVAYVDELQFHHIKDAKDVDKFWSWFSNNPSGGNTDIGRVVEYIADEIAKGKLHNLDIDLSAQKPEILIINDGQDAIGRQAFPYKVNAISLYQFSDELKNLCIASGGKQVRINETSKIITYSAQGEILEDEDIEVLEETIDK